jgi:hypothetical protein
MPRVNKNVKPIANKLSVYLRMQNKEAQDLLQTLMLPPDTMPSLKWAERYGNLRNYYIRQYNQSRLKVITELKSSILKRQIKMLNECSELLYNKKVAEWFVLHNKYKAIYGSD